MTNIALDLIESHFNLGLAMNQVNSAYRDAPFSMLFYYSPGKLISWQQTAANEIILLFSDNTFKTYQPS